jgi:hypothetical protein
LVALVLGGRSTSLPPPIFPDPAAAAEMYRALGTALTRWQYIETGLYIIAHGLMGTDHYVSSLAFFQIQSAPHKLELVDRLISAKLTEEKKELWTSIRKEIRAAIDFRNTLAHFEIFVLDKKHMKEMKPPTKYPVAISYHHLDAYKRNNKTNIKALSVEVIKSQF